MKKTALLVLAVVIGLTAAAQHLNYPNKSQQNSNSREASTSTIQKIVIQTNGVCQKCEDLFKEHVPYFKGVKDYTYDSKTAKMTISYDTKKTSPDLLRQQISRLGYNADDVKADPSARAKLPACCKVEKKPGQAAGCCEDHSKKGHCYGAEGAHCKDKH